MTESLLNKIPDFKEEEIEDSVKEKLNGFFGEVNKLKNQYAEHHLNEIKFMDKCGELQEELDKVKKERNILTDNENNISIKTESIKATIDNIGIKIKELSKNYKIKKDDLNDKRKENDNLLINLENITKELEFEREESTKSLEKKIDHLFNTKNQEIAKLNEIRGISSNLYKSVEQIENEKDEIIKFINNLNQKIEETNLEIINKKKKYKNLELEILSFENDLNSLENELLIKKDLFKQENEQLLTAKSQCEEASNLVSENNLKLDSSQQCLECLNDELKILNDDNNSMKQMTEQQRSDIEHFNIEIDKKLIQKQNLNKKLNLLNKNISKIDRETMSLLNKKENWNKKCIEIKNEIKNLELKITIFNKSYDASLREKELIESYHKTKVKSNKDKNIMIFTKETSIKNLENEICSNLNIIKKLKKMIESLSSDLKKNKYQLFVKENKLKKLQLKYDQIIKTEKELIDKIGENENLLKQQKDLIFAVKLDKNIYNKSLIDQREEMKIFFKNFNSLNHSINQIKMELSEKDQIYISQHFKVDQVDKDILIIRGKIQCINKKIIDSDKYIVDILKNKINKLNKLILKSDHILKSQYKQYHLIISESKNLSTNLIQKNNDIIDIKENIKLLNSMFTKGNLAFNDKCQIIINFNQIRDNLTIKLQIVDRNLSQLNILKSQILSMENELLSENLKVESLKNELCRGVNIHRWRHLKDTNPEIFKLIEKSHKLTKQLLLQNNLIYDKQENIHNKEKLYVSLRKILARQPGNEAREQLNIYLNTLQEKKSKLKILLNQLNIYQNKVHLLKHEINILNKDKHSLKLQYFAHKKTEMRASDV